jgi:hypothetical protein
MEPPALTISCDDCVMQHTDVCGDCIVTFLCEQRPGEAVVIDADEARAVRLLTRAGLTPQLRHVRRAGEGTIAAVDAGGSLPRSVDPKVGLAQRRGSECNVSTWSGSRRTSTA